MKAKKLVLPQRTDSGYSRVTREWFMKHLDGKTFQQAIDDGTIDEIDENRLVDYHAEHDRLYFLFNGSQAVVCSEAVGDLPAEELLKQISGFKFKAGVSTKEGAGFGREFERLQLPDNLNLAGEGIAISADMAEA